MRISSSNNIITLNDVISDLIRMFAVKFYDILMTRFIITLVSFGINHYRLFNAKSPYTYISNIYDL